MGIRIDQLHQEVFTKINNDINSAIDNLKNYLDLKISEFNVAFGLPEPSHIDREAEINKRNLEKSGFIELNRNFVPFRTAPQSEVGVWISNIETNESPFEPQTIDGQKRGINVSGFNLNYTKGNIGQDFNRMMKLPIAPNLPIFFPEDNDLRYYFQPKKKVYHEKIVTDESTEIVITDRITDEIKREIDVVEKDGKKYYYYMDDEGNVYYLNDEGRVYLEGHEDELLVEPYQRFNIEFGKFKTFEKFYNNNAERQFIDLENSRVYNIVTPKSTDATKIELKDEDGNKIFLETMTVERFEQDEDGNYHKVEITQPMLVRLEKVKSVENGLENETINKIIVSPVGFEVKTDENGFKYIEDDDIRMYLDDYKLYYYYPYSKYVTDEDGNVLDEDGNKVEESGKAPATEIDTSYVKYISYDDITDKENMKIKVVDNISGEEVERDVKTEIFEEVNYYKIYQKMVKGSSSEMTTLDENGNYAQEADTSRNIIMTDDNKLQTLNVAGDTIIISEGKPFYYYPDVGTKYYKREKDGHIYFIDLKGNLYIPDNDVQEIFKGILKNFDIGEEQEIMIYGANGYLFYIDEEGLRSYIVDESKKAIQMTNVDGYRVYKKKDDGKEVSVYIDSDGSLKFVVIENGKETILNVTYKDLIPVFETEQVEEYVLNLVIPIPFNIIQGDVEITRNGQKLEMYSDYDIEGILTLKKPLEFNEEIKKGDTLYVKRIGKPDIILRLEKRGTPENDEFGDWANNTGPIVEPTYLHGTKYDWVDGQVLTEGQEVKPTDIVKKGDKYYEYKGSPIKYEDLPDDDKAIHVDEKSLLWEDVTPDSVEWERKGNKFLFFNVEKGETIRFTLIRRVWKTNEATGEKLVEEEEPYVVERTTQNDGENLIILDDPKFNLDNNPLLESYILIVEKIDIYGYYENNRANNFKLMMTGLQTVAVNDKPAMIYGEGYFLSDNILYLKNPEIQKDDDMWVIRRNAPQLELKIEFEAETEQPTVVVPFDIQKNEFDIVIPQVLNGNEYTWVMGEYLPEGKTLMTGDIVFDKERLKFYKYIGETKTMIGPDGKEIPVPKESLMRLPLEVQKELLRQFFNIKSYLDKDGKETFKYFEEFWVNWAKKIAESEGVNVEFYKTDSEGNQVLNDSDKKVELYLLKAREEMILKATDVLNDDSVDNLETNSILTDDMKEEIKRILHTDLDQSVLKKIKYNENGEPVLDEDGNIVYYYEYTRRFHVEQNENGEFIERDIHGKEWVVNNKWEDVTAPNVRYYRFGKTFTILDTKEGDEVIVRLINSGADEFTSKMVKSTGGDITFSIDFNIENEDGSIIPFEVIYNEINWVEGVDYIQEGQKLTLNMVQNPGQKVIIRRNDKFNLEDIVVLERKDLVFIEVWHEEVDKTGFIFPFGNVQYQGTECDGIPTVPFDYEFYEEIDGENVKIEDGNISYCRAYDKGSVIYNYYDTDKFVSLTDEERAFIDETFEDDMTVGRGWKLDELSDEDRQKIFNNGDHQLYFDGDKLIQIRYRTRIVGLNLFNNYFKGNSEYMSEGLRFQGSSPIISKIIVKQVGEDYYGKPIIKRIQVFKGGNLIIASSPNSLLYKEGKLYDDALFTVEERTDLSYNGYVYAIPIAIVHRRNQGVYHEKYNANGTAFFINGIRVEEDKPDFSDDITGFTLVDENGATLETASTGRDRKAKFKQMLRWLFNPKYKAGGSMVSKTTYRPDGLLYDEINVQDIIDLRIDANDQRRRIENLEDNVAKNYQELKDFEEFTKLTFDQTKSYINSTADLIYKHIMDVENSIRKDMVAEDTKLQGEIDVTNTNLADLSANVFTKDTTTNLLIDTIYTITDLTKADAYEDGKKPTRDDIAGIIESLVEDMEGPYTKVEFRKFLIKVLSLCSDKFILDENDLERWIKRLSVKDLSLNPETEIYSRGETLELIDEGLKLASASRVLPPEGSDKPENWGFLGKRYKGWLGTRHLDLKKDFLEEKNEPVAVKFVNCKQLTGKYRDRYGKTWNKGKFPGPTIWGNVHNYHAIYTAWIFVDKPFKLDHVKMNGDDPHAIFINGERVASNKYCCRDTAYSYDFKVRGWYRIDAVYSEHYGGHYVQLGWNPLDYKDKIKWMTTKNMDEAVEITKLRINNWASKQHNLISTIKGDATGYFTKQEVKLIMTEGIQRIIKDIFEKGISVTEEDIQQFNKIKIEKWLYNENPDDPGKFTAIEPDFVVQDGVDENGNKYPRPDTFVAPIDLSGHYNKNEVVEIIRKGLELVNGLDASDKETIQNWVDRLNIKIKMDNPRYFTKTQAERLIKDGLDYIIGLDKVTSYEISEWLDNHISNPDLEHGGTDKDRVFVDANGNDLSVEDENQAYTKEEFRQLVAEKFKQVLGAQPLPPQN